MHLPKWVKQAHSGEDAALCAWFALVHYKGGGYTKDQFKKDGVAFYKTLGIDDKDALNMLLDGNDPSVVQHISGGAFEKNIAKAINKTKIIIPKNGHFLTLLRDDGGKWWNFDSWEDRGPTEIGDDKAVTTFLKDERYKPVNGDGYIVG